MRRACLTLVSAVIFSLAFAQPSHGMRLWSCLPIWGKSDQSLSDNARKSTVLWLEKLVKAQKDLDRHRLLVYTVLEDLPSALVKLDYQSTGDAHLLDRAIKQITSIALNQRYADATMREEALKALIALISNADFLKQIIRYDLNHTTADGLRLTRLLTQSLQVFSSMAAWERDETLPPHLRLTAIRGLGTFSYPLVLFMDRMESVVFGIQSAPRRELALTQLKQLERNKDRMKNALFALTVKENIHLYQAPHRQLTLLMTTDDFKHELDFSY